MRIFVDNVSKSFNDVGKLTILDGVALTLPSGSHTALLGRSGVGKTTLLQLVGGLSRPDSGSIWIGDTDICALNSDKRARFRGRHIGFVFQFHQLLPEFSASENVAMPLVITGVPLQEAKQKAESLLETVGLADRVSHRPSQLSGGEQQRVAIARALIGDPGVVLADEPTGSLDVHTGEQIKELLFSICEDKAITLVVVTHSRELADEMQMVYEMQTGGVCVPVVNELKAG